MIEQGVTNQIISFCEEKRDQRQWIWMTNQSKNLLKENLDKVKK